MKVSRLFPLFIIMFSIALLPQVFAEGQEEVKIDEITEKIQALQSELQELRVELAHTEAESEKANGLREQIEHKQQTHDNLLEKLREIIPMGDVGTLHITERFGEPRQLPTNYDNDFFIDEIMRGCDGSLQEVTIQGYADIVENKITIQQLTSNPISVGLGYCWDVEYLHTSIYMENFSEGWACDVTFDIQPVWQYDAICPITEDSTEPKQINTGDQISIQFTLNYDGWGLGPYYTIFNVHE